MAKDTFYFSHDYNSRNDIKIKKLIAKHGYLGYGIFWALIEDLYNNANVLPTDCESIAFDLRTHENIIDSVINDFDLFIFNNGTFGSLSIQNRIEERNKKSLKARESANYRWEKQKDNANAMRTQCDSNAIKESKEKESIYFITEKRFLELFNSGREYFDKEKSKINFLKGEEITEFEIASKNYNEEYFKQALHGFFAQKNMYPEVKIRPLNFLKRIEVYKSCNDEKKQLFPTTKKEDKI